MSSRNSVEGAKMDVATSSSSPFTTEENTPESDKMDNTQVFTVPSKVVFIRKDHSSICLDKMKSMLHDEQLTDVVIIGPKGMEIKCHRLVLSAACEYFSTMFNSNMLEANGDVVRIVNVDDDTLISIISYIYTGNIEITKENVEVILSASCFFQLLDLVDACTAFLIQHLHPSNVVGIYIFADSLMCSNLQGVAENFIADNFEEVRQNKEFLTLSAVQLQRLLATDSLNIRCEEDVYRALLDWAYRNPDERKDKMKDLLACIKLPLISGSFLVDQVLNDPIFRGDRDCQNLVMEAITYHLVPERRTQMQTSRTRPRPSTLKDIYVLGGNTEKSSLDIFNLRSNTWSEIGIPNNRLLQFGAGVLDGQVYVAGGRDGLKTVNSFERLEIDHSGVTWTPLPCMNTYRHGLGVGVLEPHGPLYAVGGHDGWSCLNTVERWDPRSMQWSAAAPMMCSRITAGVTVLDSKLYAVGGRDGTSCLRTAEMYDPLTNTWYSIASMNKQRASISLAALGGCLYVVGGYEGGKRLKSVERYDPRENTWHTVTKLSLGRDGVALTTLGDKLVAIGGYDGHTYQQLTEIYDPANNMWSQAKSLNIGRAGACAVPLASFSSSMTSDVDAARVQSEDDVSSSS